MAAAFVRREGFWPSLRENKENEQVMSKQVGSRSAERYLLLFRPAAMAKVIATRESSNMGPEADAQRLGPGCRDISMV
jgi:hypothetical protein